MTHTIWNSNEYIGVFGYSASRLRTTVLFSHSSIYHGLAHSLLSTWQAEHRICQAMHANVVRGHWFIKNERPGTFDWIR